MMANESWFYRAKAEAEKGIPVGDRVFSIILFVISVSVLLYFVAHQRQSTRFFTDEFGTVEMLMLYGFWGFWIITSGLEGVMGRRFFSRLIDVFGGLIFAAIALSWLLVVFPFEFAYFPDVLPESLRFLVAWITNDIARALMVLGIIVHLFASVYSPIAYKFIRWKRPKREKIAD